MDKTNYLIELAEDWRRLAKLAAAVEVREICRHNQMQALNELAHRREGHLSRIAARHANQR